MAKKTVLGKVGKTKIIAQQPGLLSGLSGMLPGRTLPERDDADDSEITDAELWRDDDQAGDAGTLG